MKPRPPDGSEKDRAAANKHPGEPKAHIQKTCPHRVCSNLNIYKQYKTKALCFNIKGKYLCNMHIFALLRYVRRRIKIGKKKRS